MLFGIANGTMKIRYNRIDTIHPIKVWVQTFVVVEGIDLDRA